MDTRFAEKLLRDAFQYSVGHLDKRVQDGQWVVNGCEVGPREYWRPDRYAPFYRQLAVMSMAPTKDNDLNRAMHVPRTIGRLVLAQYPVSGCPHEVLHNETLVQGEADAAQSFVRKNPCPSNREAWERVYGTAVTHMAMLSRVAHFAAVMLGNSDNNTRRAA